MNLGLPRKMYAEIPDDGCLLATTFLECLGLDLLVKRLKGYENYF